MPNPRLAARYAKSVLDLAISQGQLEPVYEDMLMFKSVIKTNREFANFLKSPIINAEKKEKVIEAISAGRVSAITAAFNRLLVSKGRESNLPEIITAFIEQYKSYKNIQTVKLTTAAPISEELKNTIISRIKETGHMQNIELETKVDEDLIGGFTLQVGDKLVEASIADDLKVIARQFENNDFIYKVR